MAEKIRGNMDNKGNTERPDSGEGFRINRRNFIRNMALAMGGAFVEAMPGEADASEQVLDSRAQRYIYESQHQKIEYQTNVELAEEAKLFLLAVADFQNKLTKAMGIGSIQAGEARDIGHLRPSNLQKRLEGLRRDFYIEAQRYLSEYQDKEYSRENYFHLVSFAVPQYFAEYGIIAKPMFAPSADLQSDRFLETEIFIDLEKVSRKDQREIDFWGQRHNVDVLYTEDNFGINGKKITTERSRGTGQVFFGNIILRSAKLENAFEENKSWYQEFRAMGRAVDIDDTASVLGRFAGTDECKSIAILMAVLKICRDMDIENLSLADMEEGIFAHESRHYIDHQNPRYVEQFKLGHPITSSVAEYFKHALNSMTHEEINGLLSELRYAPRKDSVLVLLLTMQLSKINKKGEREIDLGHAAASDWIINQITERVAQGPLEFGINIDRSSPVPVQEQVLTELPKLLGNQKAFDRLLEEIMEHHEANYGLDLVEDYREYFSEDLLGKRPELVSLIEKLIPYAVAGSLAAGAVSFFRRRSMELMERRLEGVLQGAIEDKPERNRLISDLHLKGRQKGLDEGKRQAAFRELIGYAKNNQDLCNALAQLERFMSENNKGRLKKLL